MSGHSLGNLILAALTDLGGDFSDAVNTAGRLLGARGSVIPVADTALALEADVDGRVVQGQVAVARSHGMITDVRVIPGDTPAARRAIEAIGNAEQIVLGPGSLFTSVIAALKVGEMAAAINEASGSLVYVCNLTTQDGETLGMSGMDHLEALLGIGGIRLPDVVVAHDGPLQIPEGLTRVDFDPEAVTSAGIRLESSDIADADAAWPQHDTARLGAVLRRLA